MSPLFNEDLYRIIFSYLTIMEHQTIIRLLNKSYNEIIEQDEYQKDYFTGIVNRILQQPPPYQVNHMGPIDNDQYDSIYLRYQNTAKDFRKTLLELRKKIEHKIEENHKNRKKIIHNKSKSKSSTFVATDVYHHCEEIKSTIQFKDLETLRGEDLLTDSCTNGEKSCHRKMIINGEGGVGKTSMIDYLACGRMRDYGSGYNMNGPAYTEYISYIVGSELISKFGMWDTAGQEDYDRLRVLSYPETDICCLCFSTVSPDSFNKIPTRWIPEIYHHMPNIPIILMGCKIDLRNNPIILKRLKYAYFQKPITFSEGEQLARSVGCFTYLESSAVTGEGNMNDFTEIAAKTLIYYRQPQHRNKKCTLM